MSKSRKIFKKLFWWLSGSKSKGSGDSSIKKSKPQTEEKHQGEETTIKITSPSPVKKEEGKPEINTNPPVEPWEPLNPEPEEKKEEEKIEVKPIILKDLPKLKKEEKPKKKIILPPIINDPEQEEINAHDFTGRDINSLPPGVISIFDKQDHRDLDGFKIYLETFNSISSMLYVLNHRKNNRVMHDNNSSRKGSYSFTGTYSYDEAVKLYREGYTEILEEVKNKVKKIVVNYSLDNSSKSNIVNEEVGFIPNVPNALMNLPASMIHRKPCQRKIRTIRIMYFPIGCCCVNKDTFKKAGITLLAAIQIIELNKIGIKLEIGCKASSGLKEVIACVVNVKNFHERLNIQKLCFPLAHPSMFRRFGFKFNETFPALTDEYFSDGYGMSLSINQLKRYFKFDKNTIILTALFIEEKLDNNVDKLINYINKQCQVL